MVLGALVVSRRVRAGALAGAALVAVAVQGAGLGLPTVWLAAGFGAAMFFTGGIGHGVKNVLTRALIQERVPGPLPRPRLRRLQRHAQRRRAGRAGLGRSAGGAIGARGTLALAGAISVLAALGGLLVFGSEAVRAPARPPAGRPRVPDAVITSRSAFGRLAARASPGQLEELRAAAGGHQHRLLDLAKRAGGRPSPRHAAS